MKCLLTIEDEADGSVTMGLEFSPPAVNNAEHTNASILACKAMDHVMAFIKAQLEKQSAPSLERVKEVVV